MADPKKEIIKAAKAGSRERVKALVEADNTLVDVRDSDGSTALHYAVWKGHQEVVAYLLSIGADVNAHNSNGHWGTTPLHAAAHANQPAIAQMLIDHGADVTARDLNGKTPLYHTTFHKAKAAAKVLQSNGAV